jgi:NADP-dependent 3-hydroxy acid dehydrogenase YdfG
MEIGEGTRALVTGASRGIGRALVEALAARGATVGLAARSTDELEALAATLPGAHHVLACDVTDADAVAATVESFIAAAGGLDLVVANAGVATYGPFREMGLATIERMTRVNWLGTVYTVHAALPHLLDRAEGHIVLLSSGAAHRSFPWAAVYGATKAAQRMFGEALRHELSGTGVSLTLVYPGEVATALHDHEPDRLPDWHRGGAQAAGAGGLAARVIAAVEADERAVYYPPAVRALGVLHGLSPTLSDRVLRSLRGGTAAPRTD